MANIQPVQIVEIDIDYCTLSYGTGACTAVLGTTGVRKCFNTFATCQDTVNYNKGVKTLSFITPTASIPKGDGIYFPVLNSVSAFSSSVNIGGTNPKLGALGKRGTATVRLKDFSYHDRYMDKYQSERVSGAAQTDEGGYDPSQRGSFFTKLKSRFPFYAGRPLRVIDGYVDNGQLTIVQTRHFIITEMVGPNTNGEVTFEAKDILTLAEKDSAVAPAPSKGYLLDEIEVGLINFDLTPSGIGVEYPTEGYAVIGNEVVYYERTDDNITLTKRGLFRTEETSHNENDTFQQVIVYEETLLNDVVEDLLTNYTNINPDFFPTDEWRLEIERWAGTLLINTVITSPTPVATLLGELAVLGVSIWWDDVQQKIKLKATKPIDFDETVTEINDNQHIKKISQEDRDEDRLTQIHFYSVQTNPTQSATSKSNFDRIRVTVDTVSEGENSYNDVSIKEVFCRWLNTGRDSAPRIRSRRLLARFNTAPKHFKITLDAKDIGIGLTDVILVNSRVVSDDTGKPTPTLLEVIQKTETIAGHEIEITAQSYLYEGNYGYIMENTANGYDTATDLEKDQGCYISDTDGVIFTDTHYLTI